MNYAEFEVVKQLAEAGRCLSNIDTLELDPT